MSETDPQAGNIPESPSKHRAVIQLLDEAIRLFDSDCSTARRFIEDARDIAAGGSIIDRPKAGLLAAWQLRRAEAFIQSHLNTRLRIATVARAVTLSPSYFSRAFKASKGASYSEYVLAARITLAKHLLLATKSPIAQIALQCGLSDQSHLTRVFGRAVGMPPRVWRCRRAADGIALNGGAAARPANGGAIADRTKAPAGCIDRPACTAKAAA